MALLDPKNTYGLEPTQPSPVGREYGDDGGVMSATGAPVSSPQANDGGTTFPHPGGGTDPVDPGDGPVTQPDVTYNPNPNLGWAGGGNIWDPVGYTPPDQDPFKFDTRPGNPGEVPLFPWYSGDGGPNLVTQANGDNVYDVYESLNPGSGILTVGGQFTQLNPDGSVTPGDINPTIRQVTQGEQTAEQLHKLLNSDSKFIQDARRQGLEQANALGGLGGTVGVGASMQAAIRAGLPIAESDANAFRAAAAQNMEALNQFSQLNQQRATQLELAQVDARTRQQTTQITTSAQMAIANLESATSRDLSMLDSETKLRLTEMGGMIQDRLANFQFKYNALLNDAQYAADLRKTAMQGEFGLGNTGLQGAWQERIQNLTNQANREANYINAISGAYDGYLNRLAELNGIEMDDAARTRAVDTITQGWINMRDLIYSMYPDMDRFDPAPGG